MLPIRSLLNSGSSSGSLRQFFTLSPFRQNAVLRPFSRLISTISSSSSSSSLGNGASRKNGGLWTQTQTQTLRNNINNNGVATAAAQIRGMKTRSSVKRLCDGCKVN